MNFSRRDEAHKWCTEIHVRVTRAFDAMLMSTPPLPCGNRVMAPALSIDETDLEHEWPRNPQITFPTTRSSSSATVRRHFSCATEATHNAPGLLLSEFSNTTIRRRANKVRIVRDDPTRALVLPEVQWKKPTGIILPKSALPASLPKRFITMLRPSVSRSLSSLRRQRLWAVCAK